MKSGGAGAQQRDGKSGMLLTSEPGEQNDAMSVWMTEGSSDNGHPVEQTQQHSQTNTQRCFVKGLISWITGFSLAFSDTRVWCTLCRQSECSASQLISHQNPECTLGKHSTKIVRCTMSKKNVLNPYVVFRSFWPRENFLFFKNARLEHTDFTNDSIQQLFLEPTRFCNNGSHEWAC